MTKQFHIISLIISSFLQLLSVSFWSILGWFFGTNPTNNCTQHHLVHLCLGCPTSSDEEEIQNTEKNEQCKTCYRNS